MQLDRDTLNRLFRYAYALSGNQNGAADLLQDTVERYLQRPPGPLACPEAYARRVMRNRHIDLVRRSAARPESTGGPDDVEMLAIDTHCLEDMIVSRDELQHVWARLDTFEREILYYWAVEDMTAAQIASTLGSRRGTVLSRIHRLRARLRSELREEQAAEDATR
jgi:RNA polymerase sigma-70 factor (ECF subfamily)